MVHTVNDGAEGKKRPGSSLGWELDIPNVLMPRGPLPSLNLISLPQGC